MYGYNGKILRIDLTKKETEVDDLPEELARAYIGGSALGARLIYDSIKPGIDPLGPDNPLVFMTGPLTGTMAPSCSRYAVCAISPLTKIWGESTSGGFFGPELKKTGFDGVIITGNSERLVYIWINNGSVEIREAEPLQGKDTYETQEMILKETDAKSRVACIGQAGENLVRYASIINDDGRAAGRTGMGAVMGSKRLKAIVVKGDQKTELADLERFREVAKEANAKVRPSGMVYREYGTASYVDIAMYCGDAPAKYFTESVFPAIKLTGKALREAYPVESSACFGCPIACGRKTRIGDVEVNGPEYESIVAFGLLLGNYDLESITIAHHVCNRLGIDTISAGVSIAFAMYLLDKGLVAKDQIGLDLRWGLSEQIKRLVQMIAGREGFGDLLAEGTSIMAERLGVEKELAANVKGLEVPMHDPRASFGQALSYATGSRGACHERGDLWFVDLGSLTIPELGIKAGNRYSAKERVNEVIKLQNFRETSNALLLCCFAAIPITDVVSLLESATGWKYSIEDLDSAGERSFNIKRIISNRLGISRKDDRLPKMFTTPCTEGPAARKVLDLDDAITEYYRVRNWDLETGKPTQEVFEKLGI